MMVRSTDAQPPALLLVEVAQHLISPALVAGPVQHGGPAIGIESAGQVADELARQRLDDILGDAQMSLADGVVVSLRLEDTHTPAILDTHRQPAAALVLIDEIGRDRAEQFPTIPLLHGGAGVQ